MPQQSCYITLGGQPVQSMQPDQYPEAKGLANSFRTARGPEPGRGYVIMLEPDLNKLNRETTLSLVFNAGQRGTFTGLYFIRAQRVSGGSTADTKNAAYMVELADIRHQLKTMTACEKFINVRCPAPPATSGTSLYYADSLNAGSLYTWQTAVTALWPSIAGAAPTLPYTPTGNPENFRFVGVSAWQAVHEVLEKIGCTTALNPFTGVFSIVRMGAAQTDFTAAKTANQIYLKDLDHYESTAGKIPATIRVFFHRQEVNYGIEKDTIRGTGQWSMDPAYSVDVATGRTGAVSGTVVPLWDDLPALVAYDGSVTNSADCSTRATARATEWLAQQDTPPWTRRYSGCLTGFLPGAQVLEVCWHQMSIASGYLTDVGAGANSGPAPNSRLILPGGPTWRENIAPPDMARRQFPVYPRTDQIVQPWDGSASAGALLTPNASHVVAGRVVRFVNGAYAPLENCWLMPMSIGTGTSATAVTDTQLIAGDRLVGRLMGTLTVSADTRPLYQVDASSSLLNPIYWTGHNVNTDTSVSGSDGVVTLDTAIGSRGAFSLASSAVTAPLLGLAMFHWSGVFVLSSSGYLTVWLEEDAGSGYAPLDPTLRDFAGSTTPDSYSMTWPHNVTAANNKYRISCKCSVSSGTIYATLSKGYGGSAFAIVKQ